MTTRFQSVRQLLASKHKLDDAVPAEVKDAVYQEILTAFEIADLDVDIPVDQFTQEEMTIFNELQPVVRQIVVGAALKATLKLKNQ
jgi:hypothetical protein